MTAERMELILSDVRHGMMTVDEAMAEVADAMNEAWASGYSYRGWLKDAVAALPFPARCES